MYERHKGDDLLSDDPRLKRKWQWRRIASGYTLKQLKKWTHFQCSESRFNGWELSVCQWGSSPKYYSSEVRYNSEHIISTWDNCDKCVATRIEAQIIVEKMLVDWVTEQYNFLGFNLLKYYKVVV